ncbi:MAG: hypothetical protein ACQCN4_01520 [Candidatus Bathyarchaeia archaeon]
MPECPYCGSNDTKQTNAFTDDQLIHEYLCNKCSHKFLVRK